MKKLVQLLILTVLMAGCSKSGTESLSNNTAPFVSDTLMNNTAPAEKT